MSDNYKKWVQIMYNDLSLCAKVYSMSCVANHDFLSSATSAVGGGSLGATVLDSVLGYPAFDSILPWQPSLSSNQYFSRFLVISSLQSVKI